MKKLHLLFIALVAVATFSCSKQYALFNKTRHSEPMLAEKTTVTPAPVMTEAEVKEVVALASSEKAEAVIAKIEAQHGTKVANRVREIRNKVVSRVETMSPAEVATIRAEAAKQLTTVAPESSDATKAGGKNQWVALLICWFIGVIGIHRFYLGYTTIGIIQLLTLGGCGIWTFIDFIRIILGDLKPMGGDYDVKI